MWVVIRLCTDDENVVNYWNSVDQELELNMDVLDDFFGEAQEVNSVNGKAISVVVCHEVIYDNAMIAVS